MSSPSLVNLNFLWPTRPLSIARWSTALPYGLAPQHHMCLSWVLYNLKLLTLLESSTNMQKQMKPAALSPHTCWLHVGFLLSLLTSCTVHSFIPPQPSKFEVLHRTQQSSMQAHVDALGDWCCLNDVRLKLEKCKIMQISFLQNVPSQLNIAIDNIDSPSIVPLSLVLQSNQIWSGIVRSSRWYLVLHDGSTFFEEIRCECPWSCWSIQSVHLPFAGVWCARMGFWHHKVSELWDWTTP